MNVILGILAAAVIFAAIKWRKYKHSQGKTSAKMHIVALIAVIGCPLLVLFSIYKIIEICL